jgi:hypothetical protein
MQVSSSHPSFQECRGYVSALMHEKNEAPHKKQRPPTLTISRQAGARGRTIGLKLKDSLRAQAPKANLPWTLFDDNLVQKVLEDHKLPAELAKFMPDDAISGYQSSINELLGRHPSLWTLFEKTVSTMVRLSRTGHCILVGHGGNEITHGFPNVLRLLLIGSEEHRLQQMINGHGMTTNGAKKFIKEEDAARRRYIKKHFGQDIDDPTRYDLVINTDHISDDTIVEMLTTALNKLEA